MILLATFLFIVVEGHLEYTKRYFANLPMKVITVSKKLWVCKVLERLMLQYLSKHYSFQFLKIAEATTHVLLEESHIEWLITTLVQNNQETNSTRKSDIKWTLFKEKTSINARNEDAVFVIPISLVMSKEGVANYRK